MSACKTGDLILWHTRREARIGSVVSVGSRPSRYTGGMQPELLVRWILSTRTWTTPPKESKVHQNFTVINKKAAKELLTLLDKNVHP